MQNDLLMTMRMGKNRKQRSNFNGGRPLS